MLVDKTIDINGDVSPSKKMEASGVFQNKYPVSNENGPSQSNFDEVFLDIFDKNYNHEKMMLLRSSLRL